MEWPALHASGDMIYNPWLPGKRGHGHADMENAGMEIADMEIADMENADIENADKHIKILAW